MEELIVIFIAVFAGAYIGWKVHEAFIIYAIKNDPESIEEALAIAKQNRLESEIEVTTDAGASVKAKGVELAIEYVNGHLYAYAKATNQFIAQGDTLEALLDSAHKRFPGKVFFGNIPEEDHQKS